MTNAFKQIRLTNVNLSGNAGRIEAGTSGSFAFTSELEALNTSLTGSINSTGSSLYNLITGVSGLLSEGATNDLSGVSGVLNSKINSVSGYVNDQISGLINNAPAALDTLKELSDALSGDADFAGTLVNSLGAISGRITEEISGVRDDIYDLNTGLLDLISTIESGLEGSFADGIETLSGFLEDRITDEISNVQTGLFDPLADRVDELSGAFTGKFAEIETNYLDKRFGGTINADLTVSGMLYASGGLTIDAAGGMDAVLFVENGKVGINTETPSEALEVSGNGKFSGTVRVADPTNGQHATTKTYVDDLFAKRKSFTTGVAPNVESMTVEFPGSPFSSAPTVNVTMEGDVYYAFAISDRTTTGFHISFSDQVLESNIVLNVSASNQ